MRWNPNFMEPAPEVAVALRAAGLPVERCERQTREPHWVRVHWTRKPTDQEKEAAAKIKAQIRHDGNGSLPCKKKPDPKCCEPKPADDPDPLPNYDLDAPDLDRMGHLALALIATALKDALTKKTGPTTITTCQRNEARNFLTATTGRWAESRSFWATCADIDPNALRDRTLALLAAMSSSDT